MASNRARMLLVVLAALGSRPAGAQSNSPARACDSSVSTSALALDQVQARLETAQDDFPLLKRLLELTPERPKPGPLSLMFERKLAEHPDDPGFIYLYGRSLIGKDTPHAIVELNRAREADPKIPWAYASLAEIYASRNFRDDTKVLANLRAYRHLCPSNLDGFRHLAKFKDEAETATLAKRLRTLLEAGKAPDDAEYWSPVWAAEFRLTAESAHDALRQRVASDIMGHLEPLAAASPTNRNVLLALADGYQLTNRPDDSARLMRKLDPDREMIKAYEAWELEHRPPRTGAAQRDYVEMSKAQAKASAEWVANWPDSRFALQLRLSSLPSDPNWTQAELEQIGDAVLKADAARPFGWSLAPTRLRVAQSWAMHGIRLKDCQRMAQESLDSILLGPEVRSDLIEPPEAHPRNSYGFDHAVWDAMTVVLEASAQLKDFSRARAMLSTMHKWLDDNIAKKDDPTAGYSQFQGRFFYDAGEIAEAEGRKLDAAGLYARAVSTGWRGSLITDPRPHEFWLAQGGTEEGWTLATQRMPLPSAPPKATAATPAKSSTVVAASSEPGAWHDSNRPLPTMSLRDVSGKTWTLADFNGKPTLVALWATWCAPCKEELPYVQKLYDLVKDRSDVQVVTFDLDENPGELAPFLAANKYTFPVILARSYVDQLHEEFKIPQHWAVDPSGVVRQESLGFDIAGRLGAKPAEWPQHLIEKLLSLRK